MTRDDGSVRLGARARDGFVVLNPVTGIADWTPERRVTAFEPVTILTAEQVKQIEDLPETDPVRSDVARSDTARVWDGGFDCAHREITGIIRGEAR